MISKTNWNVPKRRTFVHEWWWTSLCLTWMIHRAPQFHPAAALPSDPNLPEASLPNESESVGCPGGSDIKESACNAGNLDLIPELGRSLGEGNSYPLQYFCLENPMNKGAWQTIVHGVAKSQTQLSEIFSWQAAFSFITSPTPTFCQTVSASPQRIPFGLEGSTCGNNI